VIEELETLAVKSIALKDPAYFYRRVCRYYSEKFHTPLMAVYDLPWPFVFTNYLEHIVESNNTKKEIYELAIDVCYPEKGKIENFMGEFKNSDEEEEAWIRRIEAEEDAKREKEKGKNQTLETLPPIPEESTIEENPDILMESTSFAHLEEEMDDEE
jgi:hypothetical protein